MLVARSSNELAPSLCHYVHKLKRATTKRQSTTSERTIHTFVALLALLRSSARLSLLFTFSSSSSSLLTLHASKK
jgi:hypothetical protein